MMVFFNLQLLHMPDNVETIQYIHTNNFFSVHFCRVFDEVIPRCLDFSRVNILLSILANLAFSVSQHLYFLELYTFSWTDFLNQYHLFASQQLWKLSQSFQQHLAWHFLNRDQLLWTFKRAFSFSCISSLLCLLLHFFIFNITITTLKTLKISQTLEKLEKLFM